MTRQDMARWTRSQWAYFKSPPYDWRGTAAETGFLRRDSVRLYAYWRGWLKPKTIKS